MPQVFTEMQQFVRTFLKKIPTISLTIDVWSSKENDHSIMSIISHYLDDSFEPKFFVIVAKPIKGRHTAVNLTEIIKKCLDHMEILIEKVELIVRDAASTMKKLT